MDGAYRRDRASSHRAREPDCFNHRGWHSRRDLPGLRCQRSTCGCKPALDPASHNRRNPAGNRALRDHPVRAQSRTKRITGGGLAHGGLERPARCTLVRSPLPLVYLPASSASGRPACNRCRNLQSVAVRWSAGPVGQVARFLASTDCVGAT